MSRRSTVLACYLLMTGLLWNCKKSDPATEPTGVLTLKFDNVVGSQDLQLNTGTYTNKSNETFSVSTFNYYVSNIKLLKADGSRYTVPQDSSYFLVRENQPTTQTIRLNQVPLGEYMGVEFLVGVDSLRNTMDVSRRKGVLDPAGGHSGGMYWDWNSGYIFLKLEGNSPQAVETGTEFMYHVGLFGGYQTKTINNLRTIQVMFNNRKAVVSSSQIPSVLIQTDIAKIFDGITTVSIAKHPEVMVSDYSSTIATNYAQMFRFANLESN